MGFPYSKSAQESLGLANALAGQLGYTSIGTGHLFVAAVETDGSLLDCCSIDADYALRLVRDAVGSIPSNLRKPLLKESRDYTPQTNRTLFLAERCALDHSRGEIGVENILYGLICVHDGALSPLVNKLGLTTNTLDSCLDEYYRQQLSNA